MRRRPNRYTTYYEKGFIDSSSGFWMMHLTYNNKTYHTI